MKKLIISALIAFAMCSASPYKSDSEVKEECLDIIQKQLIVKAIFDDIVLQAELKWPKDYAMQQYEINKQVKALDDINKCKERINQICPALEKAKKENLL